MANESSERYMRTERLMKARQADPANGQIEEMYFAREVLEPSDFDYEASLATTAYLDYRYKTPWERTQAFSLSYQKWYANMQRDGRAREGRRVVRNHLAMWPNGSITMFWRARQRADALGVPYDRYIISAMKRANEVDTTELPAPNQLYDADVVAHVERELAELRKLRVIELMPRECDPHFYAENYQGDPVQVAALDAIETEVRQLGTARRAGRLSHYMRERRLISEVEARRRLGDSLVDEALVEHLMNPVRPDHPVAQEELALPGCFGYHRSSPYTMCGTCPVASACVERGAAVEALLLDRHGTTEIRALRVREGNRRRKQRQRDRERAGATMTLQEEKRVLRELGKPKLKEKRLKAKERRDAKKPTQPKEQNAAGSQQEPELLG